MVSNVKDLSQLAVDATRQRQAMKAKQSAAVGSGAANPGREHHC